MDNKIAHSAVLELPAPVTGSVTVSGAGTGNRGTIVLGDVVDGVVEGAGTMNGGGKTGGTTGGAFVVEAVWPLTMHSGCHSAVHVIFRLIADVEVPAKLTCIRESSECV
jgi:hypothetical protein